MMIPRGPYLTTGSQRYLYKVEGNVARRVDVTFGVMEGNTVEVLTGVEAGDEVITSGYQNFIEFEQITLERGGTT
jgi:HlyD family secretion protein